MCEYCNKLGNIKESKENYPVSDILDSNVQVSGHTLLGYSVSFFNDDNDKVYLELGGYIDDYAEYPKELTDRIQIYYCPFCGRKF